MSQERSKERILTAIEDFGFSNEGLNDFQEEIYRTGKPFVSIKQFLDDDYYFKKIGSDLWPANRPELEDIFAPGNNYIEVIFAGGIGTGKTFMSCIALCYMIGQIGSYREPHRWLGASSASPIYFINWSISHEKAKSKIFAQVKTMLDSSPYFKEHFPRDMRLGDSLVWYLDPIGAANRTGPTMRFKPGTSDSLSALGDDVIAGALDELNFFHVVQKSLRTRGEEAYDPAQKLYDTISRRMMSRFSSGGLPLGKLFLLSSAQYPDDFLERRIDEAHEEGSLNDTVKIIRKATWEAQKNKVVVPGGAPPFSDKTFRVEVGSARKNSQLLDKYDKKTGKVTEIPRSSPIEGKIIYPPVDLYDDFCRDIEGSVRDYGGEVTGAINPFFPDISVVYDAADIGDKLGLRHPWTREVTTLEDGSDLLIDLLCEKGADERWHPKRHPKKARYFHGDIAWAAQGDAYGFAVVHISGWRTIEDGFGGTIDKPVYEVDLALKIVAPVGGEIRLAKVRNLIRRMREYGMHLRFGTFDLRNASVDTRQELEADGFRVDHLSVDTDITPYNTAKEAFYEHRVHMYSYEPLLTELSRLEKQKDKVDHPAGGSKDISDSLAAAIYNAFREEYNASPQVRASMFPRTASSVMEGASTIAEKREEIRDAILSAHRRGQNPPSWALKALDRLDDEELEKLEREIEEIDVRQKEKEREEQYGR